MNAEQLKQFKEQGFVVIPDLLSDELIDRLHAAATRITEKARADVKYWPHVRTVGKQFPPWNPSDGDDVWGLGHILHPDLGEPVFMEYYTAPKLLEAAAGLINTSVDKLQMELCGVLVDPHKKSFSLTWHRDSIPPSVPANEELHRLLTKIPESIQWNTNISHTPDDALLVIPASHKRARTEQERKAEREELPGELKVVLQRGETVFYDNDIVHRAGYEVGKERRCLHACTGKGKKGVVGQHGVGWLREVRFSGVAEEMRRRAVEGGAVEESEALLEG